MALDEFDVERYLENERDFAFAKGEESGEAKGEAKMLSFLGVLVEKIHSGVTDNDSLAKLCGRTRAEVESARRTIGV